MNPITDEPRVSLEALERVDKICARFEAAWKTDQQPPIQEYLADVPESDRALLLRELVLIDAELRQARGLPPAPSLERFGEYEYLLRALNQEGTIVPAAKAPSEACSVPSPPGYQLLAEVGQGGMGIVYRARDLTLGREVAVKVLRPQLPPNSPTAARFLAEARIAGQLQHPGVPAVYQVGSLADGRPFLAMKLIKGKTLDELIQAGAPVDALAVVEAIGQAVGYAHSHGVIHRDLKPANVMVGSFGEVQVMDWGLAKVLGTSGRTEQAEPEETTALTVIRTPEEFDGSHTQAGSFLGTPAYVPPEQAACEVERIDARADVFGLGAILCVLLTGKPPFTGKDSDSVRLEAVRGRTEEAFARLDGCGADSELVALCKRCLAFEPDDRPADGGEVASALARLRAAAGERAASAERDRLAADVRALEQAKRRRAVQRAAVVVAAVLLLGVAGTTAGLVQANRQRRVAEQAQAEESRQRLEAVAARAAAESEAQRANREAATAEQTSAFLAGLFEPRDRLAFGAANLGFQEKTQEELRARDLLARGMERLKAGELKDQPLVRARLLHEIGTISFALGNLEVAGSLLEEALLLRRALLPINHPELAVSLRGVAQVRFVTGEWSCVELLREAIAILEKQPDTESLEMAETETSLAVCLAPIDVDEAVRRHEHALKIRRARLGNHDLQTLSTLWLLAFTHLGSREYRRGLSLVNELIEGLEKSTADPRVAEVIRKGAKLLQTQLLQGRAEEVIPQWRELVTELGKILGERHFLTALTRRVLAETIYHSVPSGDRRLEEAARLYEEGMGIGPAWDRNLNRFDLARTLMRLARGAEAEKHLVAALTQFRKEPAKVSAKHVPHALQLLAWIAERSNDPKKQARIEDLLQQALEASRNDHVPPGRRALALRDLGIYRLLRKKDGETTAPLFAEAVEHFARAEGPTHLRVAESLALQAAALRLQGKTRQADDLEQKAQKIARLHEKDQSDLAQEVRQLLDGKSPRWP